MCADIFESTAYKLRIGDVVQAKRVETSDSGDANTDQNEWMLSLSTEFLFPPPHTPGARVMSAKREVSLKLSMVWIQGTVLDIIFDDGNGTYALHLSDETGEAFIYEYKSLPGGDHSDIQQGSYVGVIGQIWSTQPYVIIKGAKVMYLNDNSLHKSVWSEEVLMNKAFLLGHLVTE